MEIVKEESTQKHIPTNDEAMLEQYETMLGLIEEEIKLRRQWIETNTNDESKDTESLLHINAEKQKIIWLNINADSKRDYIKFYKERIENFKEQYEILTQKANEKFPEMVAIARPFATDLSILKEEREMVNIVIDRFWNNSFANQHEKNQNYMALWQLINKLKPGVLR